MPVILKTMKILSIKICIPGIFAYVSLWFIGIILEVPLEQFRLTGFC